MYHFLARAIEKKGSMRATISAGYREDTLFDREWLNRKLSGNEATFKGFIEAVAYIPSKNLKENINDKLVFLADPSADKHLVNNPRGKFVSGVYWHLEDLNMLIE